MGRFLSFKLQKRLEMVALAILGASYFPWIGPTVESFLKGTYFGINGLLGFIVGASAIMGAIMLFQDEL